MLPCVSRDGDREERTGDRRRGAGEGKRGRSVAGRPNIERYRGKKDLWVLDEQVMRMCLYVLTRTLASETAVCIIR